MYVSLLDSNLNTGCHMRYMFSYTLIKNLKEPEFAAHNNV